MSLEEAEEDYWGSSRVKSSKKKVNIFDDSVTVEAASDLAKFSKTLATDDDYEDDSINWNDDPALSSAPSAAASSLPRPTFEPNHDPSRIPSSRQTHSRSRSDVTVGRMSDLSLPKSASTSEHKTDKMDSEPDLSTVVRQQGQYPDKGLESSYSGSSNYLGKSQENVYTGSRQDQEIKYLRQQLALAQSAVGTKLKVEDTLKRILNGQPVSLEQYKSKEEKLALLDKAIASHDGNAIITAVLFLKQTLREGLFNVELIRRPVAIDQYLAYLKAQFSMKEYESMLEMLNRTEELAIVQYKKAVTVDDSMAKIHRLQACLKTYFETTAGMEHDSGLIQQQISLLQRQRPVDVADDMLEKQGKHIMFNKVPRAASIVNKPVITTLYYCCLYHYEEGENLLSSPASIRKEHQLTEKQFLWTAVKARARVHKWSDIDQLFTSKGFFGGTKKKCVIGFNRVATILHKAGATPEIVCQYLMLVDDVTTRLELAQKFQCHDAVVETYRAQRDRQSLSAYYNKVKPNSREWFLAHHVLNDQSIKWKS